MSFNNSIENVVSTERFDSYRTIATSDDHAWELYRWNLDLVGALAPLMCDFEVALRNTVHHQLEVQFGRPDWWASNTLRLDDVTNENIEGVVQRHRKKLEKGSVGAGRVVADLTFGTWVMLLGKGGKSVLKGTVDYETRLWRPGLRNGFATGGTNSKGAIRRPMRREVHQRASNLQQLRNAAAHHRRISEGIRKAGSSPETPRVPLSTVWTESVEMLGWMSPELAAIHQDGPAMEGLLEARPLGA